MSHAEKCPLCLGSGQIQEWDTLGQYSYQCHGCSGKGWITVEDSVQYKYCRASGTNIEEKK